MAEYSFKSIDSYGRRHNGVLQAKNELDVEFRLENQGYDLISCKKYRRRRFTLFKGQIPRREMINMIFHLEQLTASGVPLLDALADLRDSVQDNYLRDILAGIVEAIEGGSNFSSALALYPKDFENVFITLIAVGEESGELPTVLRKVGETMRKADELLGNVKRVMAYPSIVGGIILAVSAFLLVYLVPKIIPFVSELGGEIPMHTEALIITSDFVANFWLLIVCVPIVLISVIRMAAKSRPGLKFFIDGALLRIPLFGPMALKVRLARFATYMALLYGAGVTVLRSLEICEDLMDNSNLSKAINEARKKISEGGGISDSFSKIQLFPPLVIRMLRVGETTGNLDDALLNVSYFYEREVQETIETIEPAISPFLTVTMGALLGWIMLSVLGPVWSAAAGIH